MTMYEESEEDMNTEATQMKGNDHYVRFYKFLKSRKPDLTPKKYKEALARVDSVFWSDSLIDMFFDTLCSYVANEVSKMIPNESSYVVIDFEYYHERADDGVEAYKGTDIVAYVKWVLGGKERHIEVYRKEVAEELSIAEVREDFNDLIDEIVKKIASEASAVVKSLLQGSQNTS